MQSGSGGKTRALTFFRDARLDLPDNVLLVEPGDLSVRIHRILVAAHTKCD